VDIHEQSHGWGSQVIEFFAIGTAVIPDEDAEDHANDRPRPGLTPTGRASRPPSHVRFASPVLSRQCAR
jgi:hypothetical protein